MQSLSSRQAARPSAGVRGGASAPLRLTRPRPHLHSPAPPSSPVSCRGLFGLGLPEVAVIAGVAALIFGPSKLPEIGKGLGKTVKSFQTAAKEFESELKQASASDDEEGGAPQQQQVGQGGQGGPAQAQVQAQPQPPPQQQQPPQAQQASQEKEGASSGSSSL